MKRAAAAALCSFSAACSGKVSLTLFYDDELVEAPTRSVSIVAYDGKADCDTVLSRPHMEPGGDTVRGRYTGRYPIRPEDDVFATFPEGERLVLDVAALDASFLQIARSCLSVNLADAGDTITLELDALPRCGRAADRLDLMLVLDTSIGIDIADPDLTHLGALSEILIQPGSLPEATTWGVVTFGEGDRAAELVTSTIDVASVRAAVEASAAKHGGATRLYDGISKGTELLRARAVCGRRPALMVVAGGADGGSKKHQLDATLGIFATRGDPADDIFTFALGLSEPAYAELEGLVCERERPEDVCPPEQGRVTGAAPGALVRIAVQEAQATLRKLIGLQ